MVDLNKAINPTLWAREREYVLKRSCTLGHFVLKHECDPCLTKLPFLLSVFWVSKVFFLIAQDLIMHCSFETLTLWSSISSRKHPCQFEFTKFFQCVPCNSLLALMFGYPPSYPNQHLKLNDHDTFTFLKFNILTMWTKVQNLRFYDHKFETQSFFTYPLLNKVYKSFWNNLKEHGQPKSWCGHARKNQYTLYFQKYTICCYHNRSTGLSRFSCTRYFADSCKRSCFGADCRWVFVRQFLADSFEK